MAVSDSGIHHKPLSNRNSFPIGFQIFFAVILIIGVLAFPESPRWLLKHGKTEEAAEIMGRLENTAPDSKEVRNEIAEIEKVNSLTRGKKISMKEIWTNGTAMNGWRTTVACASQAFQQISGIVSVTERRLRLERADFEHQNLVTYYATTVS